MDTPTIHAHHLEGFKYLKTIFPLLQRLHRHGCERDQGQKRLLHYEQYAALVLLYFFNPIVTSLRGLQHPARCAFNHILAEVDHLHSPQVPIL